VVLFLLQGMDVRRKKVQGDVIGIHSMRIIDIFTTYFSFWKGMPLITSHIAPK
jgi:hypothetical protein